jgi:hypothetical protein
MSGSDKIQEMLVEMSPRIFLEPDVVISSGVQLFHNRQTITMHNRTCEWLDFMERKNQCQKFNSFGEVQFWVQNPGRMRLTMTLTFPYVNTTASSLWIVTAIDPNFDHIATDLFGKPLCGVLLHLCHHSNSD